MPANTTVTTYSDMNRWFDSFLRPKGLPLLFVVGDPGLSKSHYVKSNLDEEHAYLKAGQLTAFQLYKLLYRYRNKAIILDDIDAVLRNPMVAGTLKMLCETDDEARTVAWFGTESQLKVRKGKRVVKVPQEFTTTSRVLLICNDWDLLAKQMEALLDRSVVVFFDPGNVEIHTRNVAAWFDDKEIYRFIGQHLDIIPKLSVRHYVTSAKLKEQGLDWRSVLLHTWEQERDAKKVDPLHVLRDLLLDDSFETDAERIEAFKDRTGLGRRSYFNYKKKM